MMKTSSMVVSISRKMLGTGVMVGGRRPAC
jgi:hypothetical protein